MRNLTTRTVPNFLRIHDSLCKLNVETTALYKKFGVVERDLRADQSSITIATYLELLRYAAEQEARPFIGLDIAMTRNVSNLGALGYLLRNAPNFEHSLAMIGNYLELLMPGSVSSLIKRDQICIWTYEVVGFFPEQARQEIEMTLMEFINTVRELFSMPDWRPIDVFFQHQAPKDPGPLQDAMTENLHFGHYCNGVAFQQEFLHYAISDADPQLLHVLEQYVQRSITGLKEEGKLIERLTFMITSQLGKADISAESMASRLGMSRRTLHRRLEEQDTSFRQLREIVMLQIAKESLVTTSVSVTELAQQLGYSDASAFNRNFKRLTGLSPLKYRRRHRAVGFPR